MALNRNNPPRLDKFGHIDVLEYKHLDGRYLPGSAVQVTTLEENNSTLPLGWLCHDEYVIIFSYGPSTRAEKTEAGNYLKSLDGHELKAILSTGLCEVEGLNKLAGELTSLGYKNLLIVTHQTGAELAPYIDELKKTNTALQIKFISDPKFRMADELKLFFRKIKFVHSQTGDVKEVTLVNTLMVWGNKNKINNYLCAAMGTPQNLILSIPKFIKVEQAEQKEQQASAATYTPTHFQPAPAAVVKPANANAPTSVYHVSRMGW